MIKKNLWSELGFIMQNFIMKNINDCIILNYVQKYE